MELKDPMFELLSSLEQIVLTRDDRAAELLIQRQQPAQPEPQRLREMTGMQVDEFAKVMGVSVSSVKSWEARRTRPFRDGAEIDEVITCQSLSGTAVA
ncbi:putative transcriptional regulator [Pantoea agglomerans]|uniref:Putative transcriptional regulator n=1 Tax=Enterobacter agglomerans TaxID=549 RepID=A0A379AMY7_ENTAG|nr:putative transcriptional regulator [Pantoea agglomerans]